MYVTYTPIRCTISVRIPTIDTCTTVVHRYDWFLTILVYYGSTWYLRGGCTTTIHHVGATSVRCTTTIHFPTMVSIGTLYWNDTSFLLVPHRFDVLNVYTFPTLVSVPIRYGSRPTSVHV